MAIVFQSLASQVAQALRTEIESGTWDHVLPGERQLATQLQVSRKTVRKALATLRGEGVLAAARGPGTAIARRRMLRRAAPERIALLLPEPLEASRPFTALWVNRLMSLLHAQGTPLQIFHGAKYFGAKAGNCLARLTSEHPTRAWIIARSNQPLQQWFAASGLPTLICGSAHPGVALPSVDIDHRALCRHSASLFLRHGHRRLAVFLERAGHRGDAESEQGFREGLAAAPDAPEPLVCRAERSAPSVIRELERVLARPEPPTGFLLANSYSYLTVQSYLTSLGLQVPRDVSLISRDEELFLRFMHPAPTYYSSQPAKFARALHQALKRLLAGDRSTFSIRIMPDLVMGASVRAPRKSAANTKG